MVILPKVPDIDSPDLFIKEAHNYTNQLIKQNRETENLLKDAGIENAFTLSLVIPDYITEQWLVEALKHDSFRRYGFAYNDLSTKKFAPNIREEVIRKVVFSTVTKFPEEHPFRVDENMKISSPDIKELNINGIDGSGINVAVIDKPFSPVPKEIEHNLKEYNVEPEQYLKTHFHGSVVSCILAGKKMGVAPNVNLCFYDEGDDIINDSIKALENIYQRNLNGANIKVVNISGFAHELSSAWPELKNRLKEQGCYVIDSTEFGDKFTGINQYNDKYYFSDWQDENIRSKMCVPTGGKFILLANTYDNYMYEGDVS